MDNGFEEVCLGLDMDYGYGWVASRYAMLSFEVRGISYLHSNSGASNVPESTRLIPFPPVRAWGSVLLHHATDPSLFLVPLYHHL